MILTMSYAFLVTVLLASGALGAERICADLGWPRRLAWCVALLGSVVVPTYALLVETAAPDAAVFSLPLTFELVLGAPAPDLTTTVASGAAEPWLMWPDWAVFDSAMVALWVAGSTAVLLLYVVAGITLHRLAIRSEATTIGGQPILVCDDAGPAVFGILKPRIVLPRWLAEQDSDLRSLVLQHEREHLAARDHLLLVAALAIVAIMPWNLALWWELKRLRVAIELDCDARVLRRGVDPGDYSEALFTVGQRPAGIPLGAVALTEPVSELERRIRILLDRTRRFSIGIFGSRLTLVLAATVLALAVNAPNAQQDSDEESPARPKTPPTIRTPVYDQLNRAQKCMDDGDHVCARRELAQLSEIQDLNAYETAQLYNFQAFLAFDDDDSEAATGSYESLLGLPRDELPDGLVRGTMRNLATLYIQQGRYEEGLDTFDDYLELPQTTATANDLYLKSTILYQMERYDDALEPLQRAIAEAEEPIEAQYQLLYVLQYQTGDDDGVLSTLEALNARWPSEQWSEALDRTRLQRRVEDGELDIAEADGISGGSELELQRPRSAAYLPIVKAAPVYPPGAAARGLEGYVVVSFTVNERGETQDIEVADSSAVEFEEAAMQAVEKYRYRPRIVDGRTVSVEGVTSRIEFVLE